MLLGEATAEYFYEATLYYAASDGVSLSPATRTLLVQSGETLLDVVLEALLDPTARRGAGQRGPRRHAGDLPRSLRRSGDGGSLHRRPQRAERTGASAHVSGHRRHAAGTGGRRGRERAHRRPRGRACSACPAACSPSVETDVDRRLGADAGRVRPLSGQRAGRGHAHGGALFPLRGWPMAAAARRGRSPSRARTLVVALVDQLCAGPTALTCARALSPTGALLAGEPALAVTDAGERVLQLNLSGEALAAAETAGVQTLAGLRRADADAVFLLPGTGRRAPQRRRRTRRQAPRGDVCSL